jgi:membrane protease YdiL (CAAX protease family)
LSLLLTSEAELRSGWRAALYVAVFVILLFVTGALASLVVPPGELSLRWLVVANSLILFPPAILGLWFMAHWIDRVPIALFGVALHERWGRDFVVGLLLATLMLVLYVTAAATTGSVTTSAPGAGSELSGVLLLLLALGLSAANEELVFRGYVLQVLMKGIGPAPAILLTSAVFGLGHHLNPGATWLGTTNTFLAGVLLCLAYTRTRSLWFPYGLHIGWNAGTGILLGFPVSGVELPALMRTDVAGPEWLAGGSFGPEGGILGTGVIIAAVVLTAGTRRWVGVSPRIQALLDRHSARIYNSAL